MNDFKFLAFNDLDESIVPLQHENMISLLHSIHREEHCGHCFKSAKFPLSRGEVESSWPVTQNIFTSKQKADETRPKCVVDPKRVFEQGLHYIKVPITEFFLFSHLNLYIMHRMAAKKFFDLHETRIFYEFFKSLKSYFIAVHPPR